MTQIRTPSERECTRCGRRERWSDDDVQWRIDDLAGDSHCVHDWDVTGSFNTVVRDADHEA
ncbi:HEWD family protein [Halobacterium jilantaiense]|uniref:HEWD domain-containing protein n=1 Tax=Halobacterium jilantaiense TaxID=355548 RepID=A0A1I0QSK0_9EURY|nr:HEWD family protein [Halobacterium jilantaiense]SEW30584.1 hypothetical protein SAMN04487945_2939 [Halobacterium jilantaiense]